MIVSHPFTTLSKILSRKDLVHKVIEHTGGVRKSGIGEGWK